MQLIIHARHCELSDEVRETIRERFEHVGKFESRATRAEVTVTGVKQGFDAEALVSVDRANRIHARAEARDVRSAIDRVVQKVGVQLKKLHDRHHSHRAPPTEEIFASPFDGTEDSGDMEPEEDLA